METFSVYNKFYKSSVKFRSSFPLLNFSSLYFKESPLGMDKDFQFFPLISFPKKTI